MSIHSIPRAVGATRVYCLVLLAILWSSRCVSQCSVTSTLSGSTFLNNTGVGGSAWSSLSNVISSDNGRASNGVLLGVLASQNTHYIVIKNFGFAIPTSAAICGIEVSIERRVVGLLVGSSVRDNSVRLIKNNIISGADLAHSGNWPSSDGTQGYGGVAENWGNSWEPDDINAADFGIAISARLSAGLASLFLTAEIDQVTVRVFFNVVLPLQLNSFSAAENDGKVALQWQSTSGAEAGQFIVERSADGMHDWRLIAEGDSNTKADDKSMFRVTDNRPLPLNYYRLRYTDQDGRVSFSQVVSVRMDRIGQTMKVYPNPVAGAGKINVVLSGNPGRVSIRSIAGLEIPLQNYAQTPGGLSIQLPHLKSGYYWLIIAVADGQYRQKIMIL